MAKAPSLSSRQARALALFAHGWNFGEIGSHLKIAPRTVLLYILHLQRYLGTRTPGDLTQALVEARLLPMDWAQSQPRRRRRRKSLPAVRPALPDDQTRETPRGDGSL
jgi:DNA-binding CsgD family transcriptional regulator